MAGNIYNKPFPQDSSNPMPSQTPAADPAQSAPSAEEFLKLQGFTVIAEFNELTRAVEAYAALRTAQLERQLKDYQDGIDNAMFLNVPEYGFSSALRSRKRTVEFVAETLKFAQGQRETLKTRAETAESALAEALEELWDVKNGLMGLRDSESLTPTKEEWIASKRELLTVAAQTPEEKA